MFSQTHYRFGDFELDVTDEQLRRDGTPIALTPKACTLLLHLLRRGGRLVTKEDLLDSVWPGVIVGDAVLKVTIRELRKALGDDARNPSYIETVHRRGYRFIAVAEPATSKEAAAPSDEPFVGRGAAIERLDAAFEDVRNRKRRVLFITGDPGIGKSATVSAFLQRHAASARIARGQCVEQHGASEAYLPLFEALGNLARSDDRERLLTVLRRLAPTWLIELRGLADADDREQLRAETLGATRERMVREIAEAVEELGSDRPTVIWLEDLHWSDYATIDVLSLLARRHHPANLMIIGTFRPVETSTDHPLHRVRGDLLSRRLAEEIALDDLGEDAVRAYVEQRFDGGRPDSRLIADLHRRTGGNPFFLVHLVDDLVVRDSIKIDAASGQIEAPTDEVWTGVPDDVRSMIDLQFDRLSTEERDLLATASVVGAEFAAATVAAALGEPAEHVDDLCNRLATCHRVLVALGLDEEMRGEPSGRYAFAHSLYISILQERIAPARRSRIHLVAGQVLERALGSRTPLYAAELAKHFEEGRDPARAVRYLRLAAEGDLRRHANRDAFAQLERALALTDLIDEDHRADARLSVLEQLGLTLRSSGDLQGSARRFEEVSTYAADTGRLHRRISGLLHLVSVLFWYERERCLPTADLARELAGQLEDDVDRSHVEGICAHWNLNLREFRDEDFDACVRAASSARRAGNSALRSLHETRLVYAYCLRGDTMAARRTMEESGRQARAAGDPFDYLLGRFFGAWSLIHAGEIEEAYTTLQAGIEMAERNAHAMWSRMFHVMLAQLLCETGHPDRAIEMAEPGWREGRADPQGTGQLFFHGSVVLASARIAQHDTASAATYLDELAGWLDRGDTWMDRLIHLPYHLARCECRYIEGDADGVEVEGRKLLELTEISGEPTYRALGHRALANAAALRGDTDTASRQLELARSLGGSSRQTPLAAWRIAASAAALARMSDDTIAADSFESERDQIRRRLQSSVLSHA